MGRIYRIWGAAEYLLFRRFHFTFLYMNVCSYSLCQYGGRLEGDLSLEETEKGRFLALTVVTDEAEAACRR